MHILGMHLPSARNLKKGTKTAEPDNRLRQSAYVIHSALLEILIWMVYNQICESWGSPH